LKALRVDPVVEYRTHNQDGTGSNLTGSTTSNLQQVANLQCAKANSASYPQQDGKLVANLECGRQDEGAIALVQKFNL